MANEPPIRHDRAVAVLLAALRIACAGTDRGPDEGDLFPDDWTSVVELALRHGVSPFLARWALGRHGDRIPADLRNAFAQHLDDNAARNESLAKALVHMLGAMRDAGIAALAFKGQSLGALAYGDFRARRAGDIDLLLRPRDREAAFAVLESLGYRETTEREIGRPMTPTEWAVCRAYQCEYACFNEAEGILVEPHWDFAPRTLSVPRLDESSWDRAVTVTVGGHAVRTLAPADLLTALCVHGSKHEWVRLQWIADIAALVGRHPELDLASILSTGRRRGIERLLLLGLGLAHDLLGAPLDETARHRLALDPTARSLIADVRSGLTSGPPVEISVFQPTGFRWRMRERWRDRIAYWVRTVATPREQHVRLAPWLPLPPAGFVPVKLMHDYIALPLWRLARHRSGGRR